MKSQTFVEILGKKYIVTKDSFDITYVDGKTIDEFINSLDKNSKAYLANIGQKVIKEDPERAKDIIARYEITAFDNLNS